jgi:hypothetical protein
VTPGWQGGARCALALAIALLGSCGSPTGSSTEAIVTFRVVNETFRIRLTTAAQVAAARAAEAGGRARIPTGRIVAGTQVNTGWSWHLEDVEFAEATIELCDGRPSDVERGGPAFGRGTYCPWSATITSIEA